MKAQQLVIFKLALSILLAGSLLLGCSIQADEPSDPLDLYRQAMNTYAMQIGEIIYDGAVIYEMGNTSSEWRAELDNWLERLDILEREVSVLHAPESFTAAQDRFIQAVNHLKELPPYLEQILINVNADRSQIYVHLYAALEAVDQYSYHMNL